LDSVNGVLDSVNEVLGCLKSPTVDSNIVEGCARIVQSNATVL